VWEKSRPPGRMSAFGSTFWEHCSAMLIVLFFVSSVNDWKWGVLAALSAYLVALIIVVMWLWLLDVQLARRIMSPWSPEAMMVWNRQRHPTWGWWMEKIAFLALVALIVLMGNIVAGVIALFLAAAIIYYQSEIYQQVQESIEALS
jgi:ABC-type nickel/cobalt efflux system permease component RcnA